MDEQDRRAVRFAPLAHVQPQAAAARHGVDLHPPVCCGLLRHLRSSVDSSGRRDRRAAGAASASGIGPYLSRRTTYLRARRAVDGAILAAMQARASAAFVGRARELAELERALDAARAGSGATVLIAGRGGHRQDPARDRARAPRPRRRVRGPARALDRSGRHRAAVPAVRRGAAPAREVRHAGASQLHVFEETLALLSDHAARRAGAARARGRALGRHIDARSRRLPRAPPRRPTGCCCSRPAARTSPPRPSGCAGSPTASDARAPRWCSSSARSRTTT